MNWKLLQNVTIRHEKVIRIMGLFLFPGGDKNIRETITDLRDERDPRGG